ncbi:mannose-1-phosphate guanylyltransferase [candidate division WOR-3 bacterium]|nr:mannose-1-phosphate guanylyltransferase [candidate division WOR-3 bacterium]
MGTYAVILCGGKGERFWPKSRVDLPKQFMVLFGNRSMVRATSERIKKVCPLERQFFVSGERFAALLKKELPVKKANLLLEPVGKNTAPAIGFAATAITSFDPNGVMVVLPADHLIANQASFLRSVKLAVKAAQQGYLVTFGIMPARPDTGYGYIHFGKQVMKDAGGSVHQVIAFKEKPDARTARKYVSSGEYLWNSGMFVWRVDVILDAFKRYMPDFYQALLQFKRRWTAGDKEQAVKQLYKRAPSISIDYAIMERAENVAVVKAEFDWDDVGSWQALERHFPKDENGNVAVGLWFQKDSKNCIVYSDEGVVAGLGINDLVIVRSGDAVLVARRDALDGLKQLLSEIGKNEKGKRFL